MVNFAVFVIGPAGVGKSTFCNHLMAYGACSKRSIHLFNLDPAAEHFPTAPSKDIQELITVDEVMEELGLGPNGGLVYAMDYLLENIDWLEDDLGQYDNEFLLVDCPGQLELYTHFTIFKSIVSVFQRMGYQDISKFFSGVLSAMSAMIQLEIPHLNIITKLDLLEPDALESNELERFFNTDPTLLLDWLKTGNTTAPQMLGVNQKFNKLNEAIVGLIEEFNMIQFLPFNIRDEDSIGDILMHIDNAVQYGEHQEPKEQRELGHNSSDNELDDGDNNFN